MTDFHCPQCGEPTETLHEGYCEECCSDNQMRLDEHNARHDWWANMTDSERHAVMRKAFAHD